MEVYVQLIFILAMVKYSLKAALSNSLWILLGFAVGGAVAAYCIYPFVIAQPVTIITQMLGDQQVVQNMALLSTAEAIAGIFISVYLLDNYFMPKRKRTKRAFIIKIIPGVLAICSIAYFELLFFKWRAGYDFQETALFFSLLLFLLIAAVSLLIKYLLKWESLKLEVKLLLNLSILTLGLLVSSSVADYNISNAHATIEWGALIVMVCITLFFIAIGVWFNKIDIKKILKLNR